MAPPIKGTIVQRGRQPEPRQDDAGDGEELKLPSIIEGTLSFFEKLGQQDVTFAYVTMANKVPCQFCSLPTPNRLQVNRSGELGTTPLCPNCKRDIGAA